ncbi:MAG: hypothetical protein ACI9D5_000373 [Candidatus Endobugula sp.]
MNINTILAITLNIGILLIASWVFGGMFIRGLAQEKNQLNQQLSQLRQKLRKLKASSAQPQTTKSLLTAANPVSEDNSALIHEMELDIKDKEERINALLALKKSQEKNQTFLKTMDTGDDISAYVEQLEADFEATENIILSLQNDLDSSRLALANMESDAADGKNHRARIFSLEKSERRLRGENTTLRTNSTQFALKLDTRNKQVSKLKEANVKLKKSIASLSTASNEQLGVIKRLHSQIERAEQLEKHQRQLITNLEQRLKSEKFGGNDLAKVDEMKTELESLRDTLKRTLIEKDFIEDHMLELDDSLEKAKETEAALERALREIETLEKHFPDFEPVIEPETEVKVKRPQFTTDIVELNSILDNNRLYGALVEFWTTLDAPTLNLIETQAIQRPQIPDWVSLSIGDNDYSVLLTVDEQLAKTLTQSIFKGSSDSKQDQKDTTGEISNIIAGTLASELDNNFSVGVPKHIDEKEAKQLLATSTLVSEILSVANDKPIYVALLIPEV